MKKTLLNEIESYRRLSNYNPKLTLTENIEVISEQGFGQTVREVEAAFREDLIGVLRRWKVVGIDAARATELLAKDATAMEAEFAQALQKDVEAGYPKGNVGPALKNLSKVNFFKKVTEETKRLGRELSTEEVAQIFDSNKAERDLRAAKFGSEGGADAAQGGKDASQGGKDASQGGKDASQGGGLSRDVMDIEDIDYEEIKDIEKDRKPTDEKDAKDIIEQNPEVKGQKWPWLKKWGLRLGIGLPVLWFIYWLGKGKSAPPPIVTTDDGNKHTGDGGGGGGSLYAPCQPNNYVRGCKANVISQVQSCLNQRKKDNMDDLKVDGKFGPLTQSKLKANFPELANGFQDADIAKICGSTPSPTPVGPEVSGERSVIDTNQDF
jgi:hypothetical protein